MATMTTPHATHPRDNRDDGAIIADRLELLSASFAAATTKHQLETLRSTVLSDTGIIETIVKLEEIGNAACKRAQQQAACYRK